MKKSIAFIKAKDRPFEVDVIALEEPEGLDLLLQYLQENYNARVIHSYEGWDVRKRTLLIDNSQIELVYDAELGGNSLFAHTPESEKLLQKIGEDLQERFKKLKDNN